MSLPDIELWKAKITASGAGRYAPSPSGELHLGNLRTALLAWAYARYSKRNFYLRIEDLDARCRPLYESAQLRDLEAIGITWDAQPLRQSERKEFYAHWFQELKQSGLLYECYCTRKELAEVASAPHTPPGAYPGICRHLSPLEKQRRAARLQGREAAWRLRADIDSLSIVDINCGIYSGTVDDFVLKRGDGVYSYNFVSVLDDGDMGITQIVRGDDLLPSTPRQIYLQSILGIPQPSYAHVPLVLNSQRKRLAKRDGAVTLMQLKAQGWEVGDVVELLAASLGWKHIRSGAEFLTVFNPQRLPSVPWCWDAQAIYRK